MVKTLYDGWHDLFWVRIPKYYAKFNLKVQSGEIRLCVSNFVWNICWFGNTQSCWNVHVNARTQEITISTHLDDSLILFWRNFSHVALSVILYTRKGLVISSITTMNNALYEFKLLIQNVGNIKNILYELNQNVV